MKYLPITPFHLTLAVVRVDCTGTVIISALSKGKILFSIDLEFIWHLLALQILFRVNK
jgi:hypothetical protein